MAVVEPAPGEAEDSHRSELEYRLRQQSILAAFGIEALRTHDLEAMLQRAVALCAEGMRAHFSKYLEKCPDGDRLLVRAGVGWKPGVVGEVEMRTDLGSPAGYAFQTGEPVISNHLENETRFRTPAFMADHQIRRAINVLVEASGTRYGVLEVDSSSEGTFEAADLAFMHGFANLIGVAIERHAAEERLNEAIRHQELLTREASHRVKNSLSLVSAMLNLQMQEDDDPRIVRLLGDAQARIAAIGKTHDRLWRGERIGVVAIDDLICSIVDELGDHAPNHRLACKAEPLAMSADAAIPLGLLVTELVTNAIKYAYPDAGGPIDVAVAASEGTLRLSVTDRGEGLPATFDFARASRDSLGMRMIASLARQLGGELTFADAAPGTQAVLAMPQPTLT